MTWNGDPIVTEFVYPPIPDRSWDWSAMLKRDVDNYCGCGECRFTVGCGPSEKQAAMDLVEQLLEKE